jgi:hypothetical protein
MNVGDLIICKFMDGKPVGLIIKVRTTGGVDNNVPLYDILVQGRVLPFRDSTIDGLVAPVRVTRFVAEVANESR